jgi:WD40 repeat protein
MKQVYTNAPELSRSDSAAAKTHNIEFWLRETVPLYLATESWPKVTNRLSDPRYWRKKFSYGMATDLLEELRKAVQKMPVNQPGYGAVVGLTRALEREITFLVKRPLAIFQCIWNLCGWHGIQETAAHFDQPEVADGLEDVAIWKSIRLDHLHPKGSALPPVRRESWMTDEMLRRTSGWVSAGTYGICHEAICPKCGHGGVFGSSNYTAELRIQFVPREDNRPGPLDEWGSASASLEGIVDFVVVCCENCRLGARGEKWLHFIPFQHEGWTRENVIEYLRHIKSPLASHSHLKCIPLASGRSALTSRIAMARSEAESTSAEPLRPEDLSVERRRVDLNELSDAGFSTLLADWKDDFNTKNTGQPWLRSIRPPLIWPGAGRRQQLLRHDDKVTGLAVLPDGLRALSTSQDGSLRLSSIYSGQRLSSVNAEEPLAALATNASGTACITGSVSGIQVWDILADRIDLRYRLKCRDAVTSVCWSQDEHHFAAVTAKGSVYCWNTSRPERHGHLRVPAAQAISFCKGIELAIVEVLNVVRCVNVITGKHQGIMRDAGADAHTGVSFSKDGTIVVLARNNRWAIWDCERKDLLTTFVKPLALIKACALTADNGIFATASVDGTIRLWDTGSGDEIACHRYFTSSFTHLTFSPDGRLLLFGDEAGNVSAIDPYGQCELPCPKGQRHGEEIRAVAFTLDGRHILTGGTWHVRKWNVDTGLEEGRCQLGEPLRDWDRQVRDIILSSDGEQFAAICRDDKARILQVKDCSLIGTLRCGTDETIFFDSANRARTTTTSVTSPTQLEGQPWNVAGHTGETVFRSCVTGSDVAWYPSQLEKVVSSPTVQRLFAGISNGALHILKIEGGLT